MLLSTLESDFLLGVEGIDFLVEIPLVDRVDLLLLNPLCVMDSLFKLEIVLACETLLLLDSKHFRILLLFYVLLDFLTFLLCLRGASLKSMMYFFLIAASRL